jgi:hypothetical protein
MGFAKSAEFLNSIRYEDNFNELREAFSRALVQASVTVQREQAAEVGNEVDEAKRMFSECGCTVQFGCLKCGTTSLASGDEFIGVLYTIGGKDEETGADRVHANVLSYPAEDNEKFAQMAVGAIHTLIRLLLRDYADILGEADCNVLVKIEEMMREDGEGSGLSMKADIEDRSEK